MSGLPFSLALLVTLDGILAVVPDTVPVHVAGTFLADVVADDVLPADVPGVAYQRLRQT